MVAYRTANLCQLNFYFARGGRMKREKSRRERYNVGRMKKGLSKREETQNIGWNRHKSEATKHMAREGGRG